MQQWGKAVSSGEPMCRIHIVLSTHCQHKAVHEAFIWALTGCGSAWIQLGAQHCRCDAPQHVPVLIVGVASVCLTVWYVAMDTLQVEGVQSAKDAEVIELADDEEKERLAKDPLYRRVKGRSEGRSLLGSQGR